jgi:hypothetical protein
MKCANPSCTNTLVYLRGGVLRLLEMESEPPTRLHGHGDGFPVYRPSARYFWLCADCARVLVLKRWTARGLILESRPTPQRPQPRSYQVQPTPAVDKSSTMHFRLPTVRSA